MIEDEIDRMIQELDQQAVIRACLLDQYVEFVGKDAKASDELRPDAERQVKTRMLLNGIAEAEKIEVSQEELEKELEDMAVQYQTTADKLQRNDRR